MSVKKRLLVRFSLLSLVGLPPLALFVVKTHAFRAGWTRLGRIFVVFLVGARRFGSIFYMRIVIAITEVSHQDERYKNGKDAIVSYIAGRSSILAGVF